MLKWPSHAIFELYSIEMESKHPCSKHLFSWHKFHLYCLLEPLLSMVVHAESGSQMKNWSVKFFSSSETQIAYFTFSRLLLCVDSSETTAFKCEPQTNNSRLTSSFQSENFIEMDTFWKLFFHWVSVSPAAYQIGIISSMSFSNFFPFEISVAYLPMTTTPRLTIREVLQGENTPRKATRRTWSRPIAVERWSSSYCSINGVGLKVSNAGDTDKEAVGDCYSPF